MQILCITHADFESPGVIETWAQTQAYDFKIVRPYHGETLPPLDTFKMLIVMGGPQSPLKLDEFPYLRDEIRIIQDAIRRDKKVLGFCLGAQLIGEALEAKTAKSPEKEVGVYPITFTTEALQDPLFAGFPLDIPVIHWHNDMPGLTSDSVLLASSLGCPRQIVRYSPIVYGLQCHLEITREGIETMIAAVPEDLHPSRYTQSKAELLAQDYDSINANMIDILDRFVLL